MLKISPQIAKKNQNDLDKLINSTMLKLEGALAANGEVFVTSSFQSHSLPLLCLLSDLNFSGEVVLTDTGFLFPETIIFARQFCEEFSLKLRMLESSIGKDQQLNGSNKLLYKWNHDKCCSVNKVLPIAQYSKGKELWISGVRGDQTSERRALSEYEVTSSGCKRFHPMLDWTAREIHWYRQRRALASHPLESQGYLSVGCEPCTLPMLLGEDDRDSRWAGSTKTECGLTSQLIVKSSS